jgi:alkanesulfonate monooxygenase SsuD/methylene tetrahydromethanopterin reductase-like flavin-dependent oxidoreductase (luciferase family)
MVALRTGAPLTAQRLVEEAEAAPVPQAHARLLDAMRERWVIGSPTQAADRIRSRAEELTVDEGMVNPVAGAFAGTAADAAPAREQTLELLAKELL